MAKYKELINRITKDELEAYYKDHISHEVCNKFNIPSAHVLKSLLRYYNIPLHTASENTLLHNKNMTPEARAIKSEKVRKSNLGTHHSEETKEKIRKSNVGKKKSATPTSFKKGHIPWNKGKKGLYKWSEGRAEKMYATMIKNGTIGTFKSNLEKKVESELIEKYGAEHVIYQYFDKDRYPFKCDFYVDTEDLFVEVNGWWHHGPHPYDPNSIEDEDLLNELRWKAETHPDKKQYKEAIRIWTVYDPLKQKIAKQNNLNYLMIYN